MSAETRATNPNSARLMDLSTARPSDVDMDIFSKKLGNNAPAKGQQTTGTVNPNYLKECREEDPWPAESSCAPKSVLPAKTATVTLSDCRIDTPPEDLATDQPFEMSCLATSSDGKPVTEGVTFRLYCTLPDGTEEDTCHTATGKLVGDRIHAEGTLYSPKTTVEWGEELKYHVAAEYGRSALNSKSTSQKSTTSAELQITVSAVLLLTESDFINETAIPNRSITKKLQTVYEGLSDNARIVATPIPPNSGLLKSHNDQNLCMRRASVINATLSQSPRDIEQLLTPHENPTISKHAITFLYMSLKHKIAYEKLTSTNIITAYLSEIFKIEKKRTRIHLLPPPAQTCSECAKNPNSNQNGILAIVYTPNDIKWTCAACNRLQTIKHSQK